MVFPDNNAETFDFFSETSPLAGSVSNCAFGVDVRRRGCETFEGSGTGFTANLYPINISSSIM